MRRLIEALQTIFYIIAAVVVIGVMQERDEADRITKYSPNHRSHHATPRT